MIRRIQLSLNQANPGKLKQLDRVMDESLRVLNAYVDVLWATKVTNKFAAIKIETWLSATLQQCLIKQAVETVKSQRKKFHKAKPEIKKATLNFDQRFLTFSEDVNSFDFWVKLSSLGRKIIVSLPSNKHKHLLGYKADGWELRKGGRLRKTDRGWFFDVYMEKAPLVAKTKGAKIGFDTGYKKLLACSNGQVYDTGLQAAYEKIVRKKQGSKAFKRALTERDQKINQSVNLIDFSKVKTIVVEDLRSVKSGSKGKFRKEFNNKLSRWAYPRVLGKLQSVCEIRGIGYIKVDPSYTSQTCSLCGHVDKASRVGEAFCCTRCGMRMDADINAAKNILMRGVYSPPSVESRGIFL